MDESERDNRLLSTSLLNLAPNGHATSEQNVDENPIVEKQKTKSTSVICSLKQARWQQVFLLHLTYS